MATVPLSELRPTVDPSVFSFATTAEIGPYVGLIGQERAVDAIKFGLSIESRGFNIVVTGEPGTGRTTAVREYLETFAGEKPPPDEWCYVNNFADSHRPDAIRFPPGRSRAFKEAMQALVSDARQRIPLTFESDDFSKRRGDIVRSVQRHREAVFGQLAEQARAGGFQLQGNPSGFFLVPFVPDRAGDQVMDDAAFGALSQSDRDALLRRRDVLMDELTQVMKQEQGIEEAANGQLAELQKTIATTVVESLMARLFSEFAAFPEVVSYLNDVRQDMIDHIEDFIRQPSASMAPAGGPPQPAPSFPMPRELVSPFRRYEVNLLFDCSQETCATVVFESNPTPQRLFGWIEKEAMFGAVMSDFTMVRAGALHRANGGYLVIDFDDLLQYPLSWNELKRTIRTSQLTIEEMGERMGFIETKTVRPEPIPWTGKIVAISRDGIYRTLYAADPDFREMFKVKADFDMHIDRTPEHEEAYAGFVAQVTQREGLPPLDPGAVARLVEQGMRLADDHNKLSIRFGELSDVIREAAYWARRDGADIVGRQHVQRAIAEREHRVNLAEEHVREAMLKNIIVVETTGEAIGQVNGLSVIDLGDMAFGQPSRITATIGVGREGLVDLQRESRLSGPIFSKAVLTLQGFLVDRYAIRAPLTLASQIAFEQNYGAVEGDSATIAETCALISRLAEAPVKQSLAITGSMDQRGEAQAIGGANNKIEGFFDFCSARGLTGEQGVIIPASNVQHLMLREDVVQAVAERKFTVHSVTSIDEALEILTGVEAGSLREDGSYPPESLNGRVLARLESIRQRLREDATPMPNAAKPKDTDEA